MFDALGIPTPAFAAVTYEAFRLDKYQPDIEQLKFPVVVRSTFEEEDSAVASLAGKFKTVLSVDREHLFEAIDRVFASYPNPEHQSIIVQEMIEAEYSGVLFAFRNHLWKTEIGAGIGAVGSGKEPESVVLVPKFTRADFQWSYLHRFWRPFQKGPKRKLNRPLIGLSAYVGELMKEYNERAPHGLDVEYAIAKGKVWLLQSRPITTPQEAEEVLSSANHKEILPPQPSAFMSGMIASCSRHLFAYYQHLDPRLDSRSFIELAGGMPWINLSSLLDIMVEWGLPTNLVTRSVGATDFYRVHTRPYQALRKVHVFAKVLKDQLGIVGKAKSWVEKTSVILQNDIESRRLMWFNDPDIAYTNWLTQVQLIYVELVGLIQGLTAAASGPARLLDRWGLLEKLGGDDPSLQYMEAYRQLVAGESSREAFLREYGHRGFYESDLGQPRFSELSEASWQELLPDHTSLSTPPPGKGLWAILLSKLLDPVISLVSTREWLRHETMKMFFSLREEILDQTRGRFGPAFDFSSFSPEDLARGIEENWSPTQWAAISYATPMGWDMDTFLANRMGRRLPLRQVDGLPNFDNADQPIGIYPGKVRGQIWKVELAEPAPKLKPPFDSTILLTESLDPGWIPFFVQVDAVLSYSGGILSHASIILRESGLPSITRISRNLSLKTGDWVEIDGKTGSIIVLEKIKLPSV